MYLSGAVDRMRSVHFRAVWLTLCWAWILLGFRGNSRIDAYKSGVRDYCQGQYFNATCVSGHVLIMEAARYGRMKAGTCISADYGSCKADVRSYMDKRCSGRRQCQILVAEPELHDLNPCQRDFAPYLEASYECVKVATSRHSQCSQTNDMVLKETTGYISSSIATETGIGTKSCPWTISAKEGQTITIKLLSFAGDDPETGLLGRPDICYEMAEITDRGQKRSITPCSGDERESIVYVSKSHSIRLGTTDPSRLGAFGHFLLKYQATGCPKLKISRDMWMKKETDHVIVRCNHTDQTWSLTCRGTTWVGELGNCSKEPARGVAPIFGGEKESFPYGILILVSIGVALGVFLGGLLLTLSIFYLKRKQQKERAARGVAGPPKFSQVPQEQPKIPMDSESGDATWQRQQNYMATKQLDPSIKGVLPPPPPEFLEHQHHIKEGTYQTRPKKKKVPTATLR